MVLEFARSKYEFHDTQLSASVERAYHALAIDERRRQFAPTLWGNAPKPLQIDPARTQIIEQVWYCGAHSDVGGGYDAWGKNALSDIPLKWMLDKAAAAGLALDAEVESTFSVSNDCCAELHDSHSIKWGVPLTRAIGTTPTEFVHRSVLDRWESTKLEYRPKPIAVLKKVESWLSVKPRPDLTKVA